MRIGVVAAIVFAALGAARGVSAQDSTSPRLRLALEEGAVVGRTAPQFELPYATADSAGPASQPFSLPKELGRVVVLVFFAGDSTPNATENWRAINQQASPLLQGDAELVGISPDPVSRQVLFARAAGIPFKLLSDSGRLLARRYAAVQGKGVRSMVIVVGRDGMVRYVDPRFAPRDAGSYVHLRAAIKAAREAR